YAFSRFAHAFDSATFAGLESGAADDNGTVHNDGLPAGSTAGVLSGTLTGLYLIQPSALGNALQLSAGSTDTLSFSKPAAGDTHYLNSPSAPALYVLASSGNGTASSVGTGTIHFADG